jgi:predicted nucleic acid-binding protein
MAYSYFDIGNQDQETDNKYVVGDYIKQYKFNKALVDYWPKQNIGKKYPFYTLDTNILLYYFLDKFGAPIDNKFKRIKKDLIEKLLLSYRLTIYYPIARELWFKLFEMKNKTLLNKPITNPSDIFKDLDKENIRFAFKGNIDKLNSEELNKILYTNNLSETDKILIKLALYEGGIIITCDNQINMLIFKHNLGPDLRCQRCELNDECKGIWPKNPKSRSIGIEYYFKLTK